MKTLDEIAIEFNADKATVHAYPHGYAPHYDRCFSPMRDKPIRLMEIGVGGGYSMRTWLEYFSQAFVCGVDIVAGHALEHERYVQVQGDQSDEKFWEKFIAEHSGSWDIIIDDGGHFSGQIITSFNCLWPHVKPGGFYCIEDLHCGYEPGYKSPGFVNSMEFVKEQIDKMDHPGSTIVNLDFSRELAIFRKRV